MHWLLAFVPADELFDSTPQIPTAGVIISLGVLTVPSEECNVTLHRPSTRRTLAQMLHTLSGG